MPVTHCSRKARLIISQKKKRFYIEERISKSTCALPTYEGMQTILHSGLGYLLSPYNQHRAEQSKRGTTL